MEKEPIHAIVIITLSITWIHIMILDNHIFASSTVYDSLIIDLSHAENNIVRTPIY